MRILLAILAVVAMGLMLPSAFAYTISDDATGGDCTQIGTWDLGSKTCTLVENIVTGSGDGIIIDSDGIIFDGNSYVISGSGGGAGIFISAQNNMVAKN